MAIIVEGNHRFDYSVAVAVVGAGACGLTAALAARDARAETLVLEQDKRPAGSTAMSLGAMCAAASREHRSHGIDDTPQLFIEDVMAKTRGTADRALTATVAHESGPAVDWLTETHDVPLQLDFSWTGLGHSRPRLHMTPGRSGEELVTLLARAAQNAGADLMTEARVQDLYADANGRVLGLRILRPGGEVEELGVGALVLATCGFGANHAMIARYIPQMAGARYFGHEGNRGDGILWGMELGGAVADMSACQGLGTLADPQAIVVPHPLLIEGGYLVNTRGERFTHELENISGMCVPVLQQPGGLAWVIFDETRHLSCLKHSVEQRQLADVGAIKRADSWEGLERACALPRGSLMARAREIDVARNADQADALGRLWRALAPLAPPFCALRVTGALFHTQGGLVVDTGARVLTPRGQPLPNLLAGGGAARGISGADLRGYLPGAGLCMAITLGRLAGRSAARIAEHD